MKLIILLCVVFEVPWIVFGFTNLIRNAPPCPKNMAHYTDDKNHSVIFCDCRDSYLYHPEDDFCYDAYRQGPCPPEHYFVLPPGEDVAKCEKNPCLLDGLVPFQDECYLLWQSDEPCEDFIHQVSVNSKTFQLECSNLHYNGNDDDLKTSKSCEKNSMLVPDESENQTKWICDCKPGFLKDLRNNSCHEAYRQGPCEPQHFFILPLEENEARCEKNPCLEDGLVPFKGDCHSLYKSGKGCGGSSYYLRVDEKDFQLKCFYRRRGGGYGHGAGGIINAPLKACPPGSRRIISGCKRVFQ